MTFVLKLIKSSISLSLLLSGIFHEIFLVFGDINSCVRSAELQYITEQVDVECLTTQPSLSHYTEEERIRTVRNVQGAGGVPFQVNPNAIPKSLLEIHADMRELLDTGSQLRMARRSDDMCTDKG